MHKKSKKKEEATYTSTTGLPKWSQSPIDLNSMYTLHARFPPLLLEGHLSCNGTAKLINTGTTVKIELNGGTTTAADSSNTYKPVILRGGPLAGSAEYPFAEAQFRWGPSDARGAEHSLEGAWFSMEAQLVHWNAEYGSIDKCYEKPDGLAIVAFLLQVVGCPSMTDNPNFSCITDNLARVKTAGRSAEIDRDCFKWIADVCSQPGYYTYTGSLTTPPYAECVTWIVIPRAVKISARQAEAFRNLYNGKGECIVQNYREPHRIHERKIFYAIED